MGTFFEVLLEYVQSFFGLAMQAVSWGSYIIDLIFNVLPLVTSLIGYLYPPLVMCAAVVIGLGIIKLILSIIGTGIDIFV